MSAPVSLTRDEVEALLPFLANGTLDGSERAAAEAAVAADASLQSDLAALRALYREMQDEPTTEADRMRGEFGLARLMRETRKSAPAPSRVTQLWRIAAVVALIALGAETFLVLQRPDIVATLAGGQSGVEASGPRLIVAFAGTATEAEIRTLLLSLGLTIADGPSALGLYTLAAPDEAAARAAISRLTVETTLVESAELEETP